MIDGSPQHDDAPYVSTGQLPSPEQVRRSVDEAYQRYRAAAGGERSRVYPALGRVRADLFGIMSVAKPFVFALVCQALGHEAARERLGANATGLPFNSLAAVERGPDGRTNPMVNAGAIATTSLTLGVTAGLYETSGDWLYDVGVPGRAASAARLLARRLGLTLFASEPAT